MSRFVDFLLSFNPNDLKFKLIACITQLPGGQISPSENYENLSRPLSLQIPIVMGILSKEQERNWGVPPPRSELLPYIYWPDRGSTGIQLTDINPLGKLWNDLGMAIHSQ